MRIIAGKYRGSKLIAPDGLDTRPTLDRAKETLFNMLPFCMDGAKCLDLFAGSGQMGLEMISRGAQNVIFVDNSKKASQCIIANAKKLKINADIIVCDVLGALNNLCGQKFDIIYIDPPYSGGIYESVLQLIDSNNLLTDDGIVLCETDDASALPQTVGKLIQTKQKAVGRINFVWYSLGGNI